MFGRLAPECSRRNRTLSIHSKNLGRVPAHLAVALDVSGSMSKEAGGAGIEQLLKAFERSISKLAMDDRVSVLAFDAKLNALVRLVKAGELKREGIFLPDETRGRDSDRAGCRLDVEQ